MKIAVATPAYGEVLYTPYVRSLLRLQRALFAKKHDMSQTLVSFADISEARNYLLTQWYDKTDASHILFVDADMGFEPELIQRMLDLKKPIVGVVSPRRQIDLGRVVEAALKGDSPKRAAARGHDFILRSVQGRAAKRTPGFLEVSAVGAGIMLVERATIDAMLKKLPELSDKTAPKTSPVARSLDRLIRAFDPITLKDGTRLSEDFSFCHRWHELSGGEIWANTDSPITHIGPHRFTASYAEASGPRVSIVQPAKSGKLVRSGGAVLPPNTVTEGKGPKSTKGRLAIPPKLAAKAKPKTKH